MSLANSVYKSTPTPSSGPSGSDRLLGGLQSIGRSLMLPIAVLPAAALLLRLGQSDIPYPWLHAAGIPWMAAGGNAVFSNLPMIFAVGIAIGLCGGEGAAALAALVGYLVFNGTFESVVPTVKGVPDPNITMGVLGGVMIGLTATLLYRRFHDIRLPNYLGFFGGKRFVPIITAIVSLILGAVLGAYVWPPINTGLNTVGQSVVGLGPLGPGIFGFLNRLLIPLGLHHILNSYFWFQLGSYHGATGDLNRYFAGDPNSGNFMAGFFPIMMFALPAACLAMIRHANFPKVAAGILLSAAFASFLTGITEPIEFAFIFVAPALYVVHALLTGTALAICTLLQVKIGFGFSAGLIDYVLNFSKGNSHNAWMVIPIGLVYAVIYYFVFSFVITRFNLATPGRGANVQSQDTDDISATELAREEAVVPVVSATASSAKDADDQLAEDVVVALGGKGNIQSVEGCITRLRLYINEPEQVDETKLKSLGAAGVIKRGKIVQVVMGTQSDRIASRMNRIVKSTSAATTVEE